MDFIYHGSVELPRGFLQSFIDVAGALDIKWLDTQEGKNDMVRNHVLSSVFLQDLKNIFPAKRALFIWFSQRKLTTWSFIIILYTYKH